MPSQLERLKKDLTDALKSKDPNRVNTIRGLIASVHNEEIAKRSKGVESEMTNEDVIKVLQKEAKKRKEAIEIYSKAGREDLESKEKAELEVISAYLPEEMSREEVESVVDKVLSSGETNFGKVMGGVMREVAGRADASLVSEIVKGRLSETE
jgi:uncharacterized protein